MYICNAYVHEDSNQAHPIYVREIPRSTRRFNHGKAVGRHIINLWGGKSAGHDYNEALFRHLRTHKYQYTDPDPCLFHDINLADPTLIAVTVDDLLVVAPTMDKIDAFYEILSKKYKLKLLGRPA